LFKNTNLIKYVVLIFGLGATHLKESKALTLILEKQKAAKKLYGAVCASPAVVLASQGFLNEAAPATCYPAPGFREQLKTISNDSVVFADNVVTSQGPGTSLLFALALGEQLYGKEKRDEIAKQMLVA
jgi:protein deglycase